jgi:lipopolysaccharide biosynthesis glycosyltransferase
MLEKNEPLRIYVGWDSREDIAFQVLKQSITENASVPVEIIPLKQKTLRKAGYYWRKVDKLASTEFTYTRYLIPELNEFKGWALFVDCDFIFEEDIKLLFDYIDDQYAIMCAQHDYIPTKSMKMDGKQQSVYPRKNWSSMMLINCEHPENQILTKDLINRQDLTGAYFHRFLWIKNEKTIGKISHEWNWLVNWYTSPADGTPKALHYTEGGPWFDDYEDVEYAANWYKYYKHINNSSIKKKLPTINDLAYSDAIKEDIENLLNDKVDPMKQTSSKVATIDSGDSFNYAAKGYEYDPILKALALGSNGVISNFNNEEDTNRTLIIRGLGSSGREAIKHCWDTGREFYAVDTGYLGNGKVKRYHRITHDNLQHLGPIKIRSGDRLKHLKWSYKKFTTGSKILICPPSDKVMMLWNQPLAEEWTHNVMATLKQYTDRPIEVRLKPIRSERVSTNTIEAALANDVHCLITYNSIAATEALLNGKPAITLGPNAAQVLCNTQLKDVENLYIPEEREIINFARHLSYCQFTVEEMQNGTAWRILNEGS